MDVTNLILHLGRGAVIYFNNKPQMRLAKGRLSYRHGGKWQNSKDKIDNTDVWFQLAVWHSEHPGWKADYTDLNYKLMDKALKPK